MATASRAAELKQQGAMEASRDPHSNVTSLDAQHKIVEESKKAGVEAFQFDPDASPEEKAAQARSVCFLGLQSRPNVPLTPFFIACTRRISP